MPRIVRCAIICALFQPVILWSQQKTEKKLPTVDSIGFKDVSHLLPELHEVEARRQKEQVQDEPER